MGPVGSPKYLLLLAKIEVAISIVVGLVFAVLGIDKSLQVRANLATCNYLGEAGHLV